MIRSLHRRGAEIVRVRTIALIACLLAVVSVGTGCEEDTQPVITKISGTPLCGAMTPQQPDSTLGLEVQFFARASSGNRFDDPTGANSALDWYWDFNGDGRVDAENAVEPRFLYRQAGDYQVTLTVKDSDGDEDSRTLLVQVRSQSADLDILDFEAEVTTEVVVGTIFGDNTGVTLEGTVPPIEELPLADRVVLSPQPRLDGWRAIFEGKLTSTCQITDIFAQYDWTWGFDEPATVNDVNPAIRQYPTSRRDPVTGVVNVTEIVTGIERTDAVSTTLPVGAAVTPPVFAFVAPDALAPMDIDLYLLPADLSEVSVRVEYDPTLTLESVDTADGLAARGFEVAQADSANWVTLRFTRDGTLGENVDETRLARLNFRNAPDLLETPRERPVRIRSLIALAGGEDVGSNAREARLVADVADCNDNELGDTMELLARATFVDRNRDQVIDYCADCNENDVPDGDEIVGDFTRDVDVNGIPDDCDCNRDGEYDADQLADGDVADDDGNGLPDDCDCDWNGVVDLQEILAFDDGTPGSFTPRFTVDLDQATQDLVTVPYNRAFDYRVAIDRINGNPLDDPADFDVIEDQQPDGILDFCQDCDDDGRLDFLQYTIDDDFDEPPVAATADEAVRADIDGNLVLDDCDCNGNGRFDRGEIERDPSIATGGLIDDCDCNDNGTSDLAEISDAIFEIFSPAAGTFSYRSSLDGNIDQVIDACVDCDDNGRLDGEDFTLEGPLSDLDGNFLLDVCDCNGDERYDPPLDTLTNDLDDNGVFDPCDCDLNGVPDIEQIAATVGSNFTLNEFGRVETFDSPADGVSVIDTNDEDPRTPWQEVTLNQQPDFVPDICQDCNANGVADLQEVTREAPGQFLNRTDLDRNFIPDECDCNIDDVYDVVQIADDPGLDADNDDVIDSCDCDDNGRLDISEIAALAVFDGETGLYVSADGINDLGQPIADRNGNLILDQCEEQARAADPTSRLSDTIRGRRR